MRKLFLVAAILAVAACERAPTAAQDDTALLNSIDQSLLTFDATYGLPDGPFMTGAPSLANAKAPGAPFPDSLKLTAAQKTAIKALRDAFAVERKADIAKLDSLHAIAKAARDAGKKGSDLKPYIDAAKGTRDALKSALDALHTAIWNVLTPAQQAWVSAHKPAAP